MSPYTPLSSANMATLDQAAKTELLAMLSNLGRQDLETRRKITDLTTFLKIKTGNVRISFPNDVREVQCPYLT